MMKVSLSAKVIGSLVSLVLLSLVSLYVYMTYHVSSAYKNKLVAESSATAELLGSMVAAPLVFAQQNGAEIVLAALSTDPAITFAAVYDSQHSGYDLFASYGNVDPDAVFRPQTSEQFTETSLQMVRPILLDGTQIGWLHLQTSLRPLQLQLTELSKSMALALVIALSGAVLLAIFITRSLLDPLLRLRATSSKIAETKDYSLRVEQKSVDEIGHLVSAFNSMLDDIEGFVQEKIARQQQIQQLNAQLEDKVNERTRQLESSMLQLHATLENLQLAQRQMVEQEKLASLGSLVAGVAHEINTPVGVAVTMSTTFAEKLQQFLQKVSAGQLRRAELAEFEHDSAEGLELLQSSLGKAARLIQSFKKVAVDQTSEERREFRLDEVVGEVMRTLRHQLKNRNIQYQIDLPEDVLMDSYPGPLGQVIGNLFNNAVIHGFDGLDAGVIQICGRVDGQLVELQVIDNGRGIAPKLLHRVFEPFVTSKLGQGGFGLGLHIVHNIVLNVLGGEIRVESQSGEGACFLLRLPLVAPIKEVRCE